MSREPAEILDRHGTGPGGEAQAMKSGLRCLASILLCVSRKDSR
jgi:hypothetical protein